jgi:aminoglycoside phosphotransferase (APT) family kinase protein
MKEWLERFVRGQEGFATARITSLHRMPGGASKETWAFDLQPGREEGEALLPLVLRIERASPLPVSLALETEFRLLQEVYREGVPVPRPYWAGEDAQGSPFAVMERVHGETLVRRLQRDDRYEQARRRLPEQLGRFLAQIHRLSWDNRKMDFIPRRSRSASLALSELAFYEDLLERLAPDPHPVLELTIRWLQRHQPTGRGPVLIHGDYRLGNIVFDETGLRTILDWELAHIGDPLEDVGYISVQAWRFGRGDKPIGGIGEREDFCRAYEAAGGFPLDTESLYYWEVFGNLKWGIITVLQALPFIRGESRSIELASLGRRTAEVELELLTLIAER